MVDTPPDFLSAPAPAKRPWWRKPWVVVLGLLLVLWFGVSLVFPSVTPTPATQPETVISGGFTANPGSASGTATRVATQQVGLGSYPALGPQTAPVTIVEFGDFECPFCRASAPTMQALLQRYPEAVRLAYRHFPVSDVHLEAQPAAEASACAARQGKFWPYHDLLYKNQPSLGTALYLQLAETLKLDQVAFRTCLDQHVTLAEIEADFTEGVALGVGGTPTWFVNGRRFEGDVSLEVWSRVVVEITRRAFTK